MRKSKFTESQILAILRMPPARIVPMLADEGRYIASESTFSRILRAHGQNARKRSIIVNDP